MHAHHMVPWGCHCLTISPAPYQNVKASVDMLHCRMPPCYVLSVIQSSSASFQPCFHVKPSYNPRPSPSILSLHAQVQYMKLRDQYGNQVTRAGFVSLIKQGACKIHLLKRYSGATVSCGRLLQDARTCWVRWALPEQPAWLSCTHSGLGDGAATLSHVLQGLLITCRI